MKKGGCGECQTSCQSACKTSCTVGNQALREQQPLVYKGCQTCEDRQKDKEEADKKPLRSSRIVGGIFVVKHWKTCRRQVSLVAKHLEKLPVAGFFGVCLHLLQNWQETVR